MSKDTFKEYIFPNVAGVGRENPDEVDDVLCKELELAGIDVLKLPEFMRSQNGEPQSVIAGNLCHWSFKREWYYWVAKGPGIPPNDAMKLHAKHGKSVRVLGSCACPSPNKMLSGFAVGLYHIDTQNGLTALANLIKGIYLRQDKEKGI